VVINQVEKEIAESTNKALPTPLFVFGTYGIGRISLYFLNMCLHIKIEIIILIITL
jgi:hypothetical protein